jgi:hypothetical protein
MKTKKQSKKAATETKEYRSTFIDSNLCNLVKVNTELIRDALAQKGKANLLIGEHLCTLKSQFEKIAKDRKNQQGTAVKAFNEYIQVQFDIGTNRASEYLRVTELFSGIKVNLEISKLVELSRLEKPALSVFLKKYPENVLSKMPVRKVRDLVRPENINKRNRGKSVKAKNESQATNPEPSFVHQLKSIVSQEISTEDIFVLAVENMMDKVANSPIPKGICDAIEQLVKWKKEKQLKVAG